MVQLALSWVLRRKEMTSALIGVRTLDQLKDNLGVLNNLELSEGEMRRHRRGDQGRADGTASAPERLAAVRAGRITSIMLVDNADPPPQPSPQGGGSQGDGSRR